MKTITVAECGTIEASDTTIFDLTKMEIKDCVGCWSCWCKTPGRCAFKDLDEFYHSYITADKVIFLSKVSKGFVSGNLKTLFDRMIPLFLPYVTLATGESRHIPRYEKYPDIEFYYEGEFENLNDRKIFTDYITRVFDQFYSQNLVIKPICELRKGIKL